MGLFRSQDESAVSPCSANSMAYAIEFGGTSLCRVREGLNQTFPNGRVGGSLARNCQSASPQDGFSGLDLSAYEFDANAPDEAFRPGGTLRPHWRGLDGLLRGLDADGAEALQRRTAATSSDVAVPSAAPGPLDGLPLLLPEREWRLLEAGLAQRVAALNRLLADVYDRARIVRDGVIPAAVVRGSAQFRIAMRGFAPPLGTCAAVCAVDVGRTPEGFRVLRDNVRCPAGAARMIAHRAVLEETLPTARAACRPREVAPYAQALFETLCELASEFAGEPRIVLLTPGPYNAGFAEHAYLAQATGIELVEGNRLLVEDGHLHLRTPQGPVRVHGLYRQVDDDFLDPLAFRADSVLGIPGLLHACRLGNVAVANAPGTGVADEPDLSPYIPETIRYYLGEEPLLAGVEALPGPVPALSRAPCLVDGRLRAGSVTLRCFVLQGRTTRIVPGGLCQVLPLAEGPGTGGLRQPRSKDVWVVPDAEST